MKKIFLLILLVNFQIFAQLKIEYNYTMGNIESSTIAKCYLFTDGIKSKFVRDRVINGFKEATFRHSDPRVVEYFGSKFKSLGDSIGQIVVKKMNSDSVHCRYFTPENKYVKVFEKSNPTITILNEFKAILNYKCQKATVDFGERVFEVWFTPDVPISDGPWKIQGLPGLVVSAKTIDGLHSFEITSLVKIPAFDDRFFDYTYSSIVSKKDFVDNLIRVNENKFKYRKSQITNGGTTAMTIDMLDVPLTHFK
jgi:GLPGLI family protein